MTPPRRQPAPMETTDATPAKGTGDVTARIARLERAVAQLAIPGHIDVRAETPSWIPDQLRGASKPDLADLVGEYGQERR